jgi:DNA recombination protein RmuC
VGEELYQRLAIFTGHLQKIGKSLDNSVKAYNSAVGSFDSRVLPGAQKFTEMGISEKKAIEDIQQIETGLREIQQSEADNS